MSELRKKAAPISIGDIKKQLLTRKAELEVELSDLGADRLESDQVQDLGDQALSSTMETLRNSLHDTRIGEYQRVNKALEMIEDGTYGKCVDCGNPISEKRLKLFPNAARCLACQEAFEEGRIAPE